MIELRGAGVTAPTGGRVLLQPLNLTLVERRIALIGPNGSGKTTLLRLLNGLTLPSTGQVLVDGLDTTTEAAKVRRRVGFVFTDPLHQLVLSTPLDDVELSLRGTVPNRAERQRLARDWLARYGLATVAEQSIYDLSGGERQLAALVGVLAVEPDVLVCDEPTTLLDLGNRNRVTHVLATLPQQVIIATHDLDLAADFERVLLIDQGRVVASGAPTAVIDSYRGSRR